MITYGTGWPICTVDGCDHEGNVVPGALSAAAYIADGGHAVCVCHPLDVSEVLDVYAFPCVERRR